jgi:CheY-like chemotaxis protein
MGGSEGRSLLARLRKRPRTTLPSSTASPSGAAVETILVVDDDEVVRALMREILQGAGYAVLEAAGGEEALALWRLHRARIALVLVGIVLRDMTGSELVLHLAMEHRGTRFLYISAHGREAIGTLDPTTPILQKPFSPEDLLQRVREALVHRG